MTLKKIFNLNSYLSLFRKGESAHKKSYSQCGEDIIIENACRQIGIENPFYIDIGTNTPVAKNNTYLFYSRGCSGICIEPSPLLADLIRMVRPRDICLQVGIGPQEKGSADYYVMTSKALNTFSKEEAEAYTHNEDYGTQKIEKVLKVSLITLNDVLAKHAPSSPDIISIDTEGYDLEILKSLDWQTYRPKIFCVETLRYENGKLTKEKSVEEYLLTHNYILYADTYVNSIFIDKALIK